MQVLVVLASRHGWPVLRGSGRPVTCSCEPPLIAARCAGCRAPCMTVAVRRLSREQRRFVGGQRAVVRIGQLTGARPKTTRWNIHIMYQAAKMTTEKVRSAAHLLYCQVAERDQELADEAGHSGKPMLAQHEEHEEAPSRPASRRQSAERGDQAGVRPLVDDADAEEERTGVEPVRQHHHHRAVQPFRSHDPAMVQQMDEDAERDEAHVADRRVGDQLLHVGLDERDQRAVDDGDDRQDDDPRSPSPRSPPGRAAD